MLEKHKAKQGEADLKNKTKRSEALTTRQDKMRQGLKNRRQGKVMLEEHKAKQGEARPKNIRQGKVSCLNPRCETVKMRPRLSNKHLKATRFSQLAHQSRLFTCHTNCSQHNVSVNSQ